MSDEPSQLPPFRSCEQHEFLAKQEGDWNVRCSYSMGPDIEPMEVDGFEQSQMLGPFWLTTRFEADLLGSPMNGRGSTGYDPVRKVFLATWQDSSNPFLYTFEGYHDQENDILKLSGENYDPMRQVRSIYRSHIEYFGDDEKRLTLTVEIAGGEIGNILEYHYTRA